MHIRIFHQANSPVAAIPDRRQPPRTIDRLQNRLVDRVACGCELGAIGGGE
jgi:hypothetical protein